MLVFHVHCCLFVFYFCCSIVKFWFSVVSATVGNSEWLLPQLCGLISIIGGIISLIGGLISIIGGLISLISGLISLIGGLKSLIYGLISAIISQIGGLISLRDRLHRETIDFLSPSTALHSCQNILSKKGTMEISLVPGGAAEPQGQVVQGGGQLPNVKGVGQGQAAGIPGQVPSCFLLDMLVVVAEGLVDVEQEDSVGALADGALGRHAGAVERATTVIGCDVNKLVKSSLHSEKVKIWKSVCGFFNITQNNKYWQKKNYLKISSITWFFTQKIHSLSV